MIPLALEKPVYLRSDFQLEGRPRVTLELTKRIDTQLRETSARGLDPNLVFWDVAQHPGAYRIAGRYQVNGFKIFVQFFLSSFVQQGEQVEEKDVGQSFPVEGEVTELDKLASSILPKADKLIVRLKK